MDLYPIRNRFNALLAETPDLTSRLNLFLNVLTIFSAAPFDGGWYGGVLMCSTPKYCKNSVNSLEQKLGPLSASCKVILGDFNRCFSCDVSHLSNVYPL